MAGNRKKQKKRKKRRLKHRHLTPQDLGSSQAPASSIQSNGIRILDENSSGGPKRGQLETNMPGGPAKTAATRIVPSERDYGRQPEKPDAATATDKSRESDTPKKSVNFDSREPLISVCMIVRNEAENLPECLQLAQGFADEIIVVDTGSEDDTVAVAEKYGARVFHFPWRDDFSAARNESLRAARGKWIIWLDADDRIYPSQHAKIRRLAQRNPDRAFHFILQNRGVDSARCYQLRMFPNHPNIRFERPVHEQVATSIKRLGLASEETDVVLMHTGYSSKPVVIEKKKKYLAMMKAWLKDHPDDLMILYQYALAQHTLKQHEEAVVSLKKLLSIFPEDQKKNPFFLYSLILLGRSLLNVQRLDEALEYLETARKMQPESSFILVSIGEVLVEMQEYEKAIRILQCVDDRKIATEIGLFALDYTVIRYGKHALLGRCLLAIGQEKEGIGELETAIRIRPNGPEAYKFLAEHFQSKGENLKAAKHWQLAAEHNEEDVYSLFKWGECLLLENQLARAERIFRRALHKKADLVPAWINLAIALRGMGRFRDALSALRIVEEKFPEYRDVFFQLALTYLDEGNFEGLIGVAKKNPQDPLIGMLVQLWHQENAALQEYGGTTVYAPENPTTGGTVFRENPKGADLYLEEIRLRRKIARPGHSGTRLLLDLARIQLKNHRVFQAIRTYEKLLIASNDPEEIIRCLEQVAWCYQAIDLPDAKEQVKKKIAELRLASQSMPLYEK